MPQYNSHLVIVSQHWMVHHWLKAVTVANSITVWTSITCDVREFASKLLHCCLRIRKGFAHFWWPLARWLKHTYGNNTAARTILQPLYMSTRGWWRWALLSPDGVALSWMVDVSASVNLPLRYKVQKFSSGTGSAGWSRKKGHKTVVVWYTCQPVLAGTQDRKWRISLEWSYTTDTPLLMATNAFVLAIKYMQRVCWLQSPSYKLHKWPVKVTCRAANSVLHVLQGETSAPGRMCHGLRYVPHVSVWTHMKWTSPTHATELW